MRPCVVTIVTSTWKHIVGDMDVRTLTSPALLRSVITDESKVSVPEEAVVGFNSSENIFLLHRPKKVGKIHFNLCCADQQADHTNLKKSIPSIGI